MALLRPFEQTHALQEVKELLVDYLGATGKAIQEWASTCASDLGAADLLDFTTKATTAKVMKWLQLKDGIPGDMPGSFFLTGAPHATGFVNFLRHAHCEGMKESITEEVSAALLNLDESEWEEKEDEDEEDEAEDDEDSEGKPAVMRARTVPVRGDVAELIVGTAVHWKVPSRLAGASVAHSLVT